jgi:hypothetical protein
MSIKNNISGRAFIIENATENTELLNNAIRECNELEKNNSFFARMAVGMKKYKVSFSFNKEFKDCTEAEKFIFSENGALNYDNVELLRKDSEFSISYDLKCELEEIVLNKVKEIYSDIKDEIAVQHSGLIKYGIGYKMDTHRDGNNRICTAVLYLNSKGNNKGGDLIFYEEDEVTELCRYAPIKNDLIIFDSHFYDNTLSHSVDATVDWERYVFRIYFKKIT